MARLVQRERLDARGEPCFALAAMSTGRTPPLRCGRTRDRRRRGRFALVVAQLASHDERDRDGRTPGVGLDVDRSGVLVPSAFDTDHPGIEVDIEPTQSPQLSAAQACEQRRPTRVRVLLAGARRADVPGRGSPCRPAAQRRGKVKTVGRITAIRSSRIARRQITRNGSSVLVTVDADKRLPRRRSTTS